MPSTAPKPVYSSAGDLSLTYEQTIAAMGALRRIPGSRYDGPLHALILPVWQQLNAHACKTAPSSDQYDLDTSKAMRKRPRKADMVPFQVAAAENYHQDADPVAEAVAIVRNLDITDIDWSKEPASDYERRIRIEYLIDVGIFGLLRLQLKVVNPASDLRKVLAVLKDETEKARVERERQRIQDIRAKIDREGRA